MIWQIISTLQALDQGSVLSRLLEITVYKYLEVLGT